MSLEPEDVEEVKVMARTIAEVMQSASIGWPLNKRETMAAFVMMGLTSRLQPVAVTKSADRVNVVELGVKVADEVLARLAEEPKP